MKEMDTKIFFKSDIADKKSYNMLTPQQKTAVQDIKDGRSVLFYGSMFRNTVVQHIVSILPEWDYPAMEIPTSISDKLIVNVSNKDFSFLDKIGSHVQLIITINVTNIKEFEKILIDRKIFAHHMIDTEIIRQNVFNFYLDSPALVAILKGKCAFCMGKNFAKIFNELARYRQIVIVKSPGPKISKKVQILNVVMANPIQIDSFFRRSSEELAVLIRQIVIWSPIKFDTTNIDKKLATWGIKKFII